MNSTSVSRNLGVLLLLALVLGNCVQADMSCPLDPPQPTAGTPHAALTSASSQNDAPPSGEPRTAGIPATALDPASPPSSPVALPSGQIWVIETADRNSGGSAGTSTSLALDAAGYPHISYYTSYVGYDLRYAYFDGTVWVTQTVDRAGRVGQGSSLALDAAGLPHISYSDETNACLKYAYYDGTTWISTTVDTPGGYTSLALDAAGYPHISHSGLRYTYFDGGSWHSRLVDTDGNNTSLALDGAGRPHISYLITSYAYALVKYARFDGAAWRIEEVVVAGDSAGGTSLALDAAGRPHFCYGDNDGFYHRLRYASYDGSAWRVETVDGDGYSSVGGDCALALDAAGHPHISYYDFEHGDLKYAVYDGAAWQIETVDSAGSVGASTSLVLDAAGRPHISYKDDSRKDLKYAYTCAPLAGIAIDGPRRLPVGQGGLYSATYAPLTTTLPVRWRWSNGAATNTAVYTWTGTGDYTVAVTASNACSAASTTLTTTVFCQPLTGLAVAGPSALLAGQTGTYLAIPQPITASLPLTTTWDNGGGGPTAGYSWTVPGTYTLTVTSTNVCGEVQQTSFTVRVLAEWPYHRYLPWYDRNR